MIDVRIKTSPCADPKILIGRQAENNAVNVVFDLSFLIQNFGDGTAVLVHQRTKDNAPYIVTTQQDGSTLSWNVSQIDTAYVGVGQAELRWTVGNTLAKTIIYKTWTVKSITADEVMPDEYQSWYDAMIEYIDQLKVDSDARLVEAVENARQSATSAAESATQAAESETTATTKAAQAAVSASNAAGSATAAAQLAADADISADRAEQAAATQGYLYFYIDQNGDLIYQRTDNVDVTFYLNDGDLFVRG